MIHALGYSFKVHFSCNVQAKKTFGITDACVWKLNMDRQMACYDGYNYLPNQIVHRISLEAVEHETWPNRQKQAKFRRRKKKKKPN